MEKSTAAPRRLGIAAVERRTGWHRTTIWRKQKAGDFPACHYIGERRMWWQHDLEAWEAAQMARPPRARRGAANLTGEAKS